jgi:NADH-quinone oxidoreductase subunit H
VMPIFWFLTKLLVLLFGTVWLRASLPRLRYDQLMDIGWKYLIELAFLFAMVSGVYVIARQEDWPAWVYVAAPAGAIAVYAVLYLCIPRRDEITEDIR